MLFQKEIILKPYVDARFFQIKALINHFVKIVKFFKNCGIFHEFCDRMRFEADCMKSHHGVISEGLDIFVTINYYLF